MSQDFADKEKAFLETLKADTGRDLDEWMLAISAEKLAHRNDIIDWLRHQGFIFSRASWLERIHHNGGQPIYLEVLPPSQPVQPIGQRPGLRIVASNPNVITIPKRGTVEHVKCRTEADVPAMNDLDGKAPGGGVWGHLRAVVTNSNPIRSPRTPSQSVGDLDSINNTIAKAKAFVPLARHIVSEVELLVPGVKVRATAKLLHFLAPDEFAALVVGPKGLKLCLDLGNTRYDPPLVATDAAAGRGALVESFTHMILLDDARQIDSKLLNFIGAAHQNVNE